MYDNANLKGILFVTFKCLNANLKGLFVTLHSLAFSEEVQLEGQLTERSSKSGKPPERGQTTEGIN